MKLESISDHLDVDDLLGCIKYQSKYQFFMQDISDWILNYEKYDPASKDDLDFRDGLLNISDQNIPAYLAYLQAGEVQPKAIQEFLTTDNAPKLNLFFFVDFDSSTFVNGFPHIGLEAYLPHDRWTGIWGDPRDHLPDELKKIWLKGTKMEHQLSGGVYNTQMSTIIELLQDLGVNVRQKSKNEIFIEDSPWDLNIYFYRPGENGTSSFLIGGFIMGDEATLASETRRLHEALLGAKIHHEIEEETHGKVLRYPKVK